MTRPGEMREAAMLRLLSLLVRRECPENYTDFPRGAKLWREASELSGEPLPDQRRQVRPARGRP